jgi:hypothetical protein
LIELFERWIIAQAAEMEEAAEMLPAMGKRGASRYAKQTARPQTR